MTNDAGDRRAHPRCDLEMWVDETHGEVTYYQRAANVSAGGMYLEGTLPHPPGTQVRLKFTLPGDDQPTEVLAEVVATDASLEEEGVMPGMHLRFVELGDDVRDKLAALGGG